MPYSMKSPPDWLKNLPAGAQKIGISVFNSTLSKTDDEDKARTAAWSAIKTKYTKSSDGKWARKKEAEMEEARGLGTAPSGLGGTDICVCPDCGYETEHTRGKACNTISCPKCGTKLAGKGMPQPAKGKKEGVVIDKRLPEVVSLVEAHFDDDKKEIDLCLIEKGWSKNGNYYSETVVESLATKIQDSRKMFADHSLQNEQTKRFGRSIKDWAATVEDTWVDKGHAYAKVSMEENQNTVWLYESAKRHPSEIGVSIDARARVSKGKVDGKEGTIVEEILSAHADFVSYPSAGGRVMRIAASMGGEGDRLDVLEGGIGDYLDRQKKIEKERGEYWDVFSALRSVISSFAKGDELSEKDFDKKIEDVLNEFKTKVQSLSLRTILGKKIGLMYEALADTFEMVGAPGELAYYYEELTDITEEEWSAIDLEDVTEATTFSDTSWATVNKSDLPASAFLIVGDKDKKGTWHLPYKDASGKVNKGALRALSVIVKSGQFRGQKLSFSIPQAIKTKIEGLLKLAKIGKYAKKKESTTEGGDGEMTAEEKQELDQKFAAMETKLQEAESKREKAETKLAALETKLQEAEKKLDDMEVAKKLGEREVFIEAALKEAKFPEVRMTDFFRKSLSGLETEDDVKESIKDRLAMLADQTGKVKGMGESDDDSDENKQQKGLSLEEGEKLLTGKN